jgi:hypothetical protein
MRRSGWYVGNSDLSKHGIPTPSPPGGQTYELSVTRPRRSSERSYWVTDWLSTATSHPASRTAYSYRTASLVGSAAVYHSVDRVRRKPKGGGEKWHSCSIPLRLSVFRIRRGFSPLSWQEKPTRKGTLIFSNSGSSSIGMSARQRQHHSILITNSILN